MEEEIDAPRRLTRRVAFWVLVGLGVVIVALGAVVGTDYGVYHDKVHPGVNIGGIDVGGMTGVQAEAALSAAVERARRSPIQLVAGGAVVTVMPDDVGTSIDVPGAVKQALALTHYDDFFTDAALSMELYFRDQDVPLRGMVDEAKMDDLLTRLGRVANLDPVDAGLTVRDGAPAATEPRDGRAVDRAALEAQLETLLFSLHSTTLDVPMKTTSPAVSGADNEEALALAKTMTGAPITLVAGDRTWTIGAEQLAGWLEFAFTGAGGADGRARLGPYLSTSKMEALLDTVAAATRTEPTNARFANDGSTAWVVPGTEGRALDRTATAAAISAAAAQLTGRTAEAIFVHYSSTLPTAKAEAMGLKDKLGSFTTKYSCPANRRTNVRLTTQFATDVFLAPGEEYDFDKRIGARTPERGYKLAPGIGEDKKMEMVYGGGICQVSTTMFNAVFFAGLEVTERWNHSLYINHYPLGRDATVTTGGKNLRFVNDTGHYLWITGTSDGVTTTITIFGTNEGRKVTYSTRGRAGSYVEVARKVTLPDGSIVHSDTFVSTW